MKLTIDVYRPMLDFAPVADRTTAPGRHRRLVSPDVIAYTLDVLWTGQTLLFGHGGISAIFLRCASTISQQALSIYRRVDADLLALVHLQ